MSPHRILLVSLLPLTPLTNAAPLCDFESALEMASLRWASQGESEFSRSADFATSGASSLRFVSPRWRKGLPEWPAFELKPAIRDWRGFDRLVVDVTNPRAESQLFSLFVSDSKVPFRKGLAYRFELPPRGFRRFVVPLSTFPDTVNRADIEVLHFFTERPTAEMVIHLDHLVLLKQDEELPPPGPATVRQLAGLQSEKATAAANLVNKASHEFGRGGMESRIAAMRTRLKEIVATLDRADLTLELLDRCDRALTALPGQLRRMESIARIRKQVVDSGRLLRDPLIGIASPMEKVLPRGAELDIVPAGEIKLSLARNEKESFQVVVVPVAGDAKQVAVSVGDLKSDNDDVFPASQIDCDVVGYVKTKTRPPYGTPHIGWWPDPLLDFLGPVDVAAGDAQSFWIRVRAAGDQRPGAYRGTLTVSVAGKGPRSFPLEMKVRSFTLPIHSPLPTAITFSPSDHPTPETGPQQNEWRQRADYPRNAWKRHKLAWADMLADYYIDYDNLYRHGPPDFEVLKHLHDQGRLVAFNLGIFDRVSRKPETAEPALEDLRSAYRQAKELGLLDHAYIYGFDECKPEMFPLLEKTARTLKREFPGVLLMTTSYDNSYGMDTVVKTIDAWCPLTPRFEPARVAGARAAGKQVWWYICCGPHNPHANMFIEYPAIEARLLMGPMTAMQQPDGFLYYQMSIWNSRKPITGGPFTDWDPRSWTSYHGDGSWTCVGPDGTPLPTIRLENFRDGLEDYAYHVVLAEIVRRREAEAGSLTAKQSAWLAKAKAALPVPASLVKSMTEYSRDPTELSAWRDRLADLIDQSGMPDVDPWGPDFDLRGK